MSTPMTLGDKARAIGRMFDAGRESEAYTELELMLKERSWPQWIKEDIRLLGLDEKPKPRNEAGL